MLVLLVLSLWRYMEQRYKATNQAYWSVITLTAKDGKLAFDKAAPGASSPTHAGGVVFRRRGGTAKYLLVEAANDPSQWVLPKGHVESGEPYRETAVREVHEEAGIWARIIQDMGDVTYTVGGTVITVRFLLMQAIGRGLQQDPFRTHVWLPLPEAVAKASHIETRELLRRADTHGGNS